MFRFSLLLIYFSLEILKYGLELALLCSYLLWRRGHLVDHSCLLQLQLLGCLDALLRVQVSLIRLDR